MTESFESEEANGYEELRERILQHIVEVEDPFEKDLLAEGVATVLMVTDDYVLTNLHDDNRVIWMLDCINDVKKALKEGKIKDTCPRFTTLIRKMQVYSLFAIDAETHNPNIAKLRAEEKDGIERSVDRVWRKLNGEDPDAK